ncbi:MAG TPA: GDSL-type esterase/lipase family protein, partial [Vicinamibacterales bacterium]|nr:GDSL-type esterase/lipase family protein [Vicinamibacterales bacterium]
MRRFSAIVLLALFVASTAPFARFDSLAAGLAQDRQASTSTSHWVGTWKTALIGRPPYPPPDPAAPPPAAQARVPFPKNQTLRQIVHTTVGGDRVRVVVSNVFGTAPLVIGAAHVARRDHDAAIVAGSGRALTFGGRASATIPAGATLLSDAAAIAAPAFSDLAIDLFVASDTTGQTLTIHRSAFQTNYVTTSGNQAGEPDLPEATKIPTWFFLERVEVSTSDRTVGIVTLGDSITDGTGSTLDANHRWPDVLARRLEARSGSVKSAVLNSGIAGNRLLTEQQIEFGINILARFDRDVLVPPGVTHVIVLEGINDIGMARDAATPSADDVIAAHTQLIERAHAHGLKIFGATLTPFEGAAYYTPAGETKRAAVNEWIRTSRAYDAVVDFDAVVRDPDHPKRMLQKFDRGDHLHPSDAGYEAMGNAVELSLFGTGPMSKTDPLKYPVAKKGDVIDDYAGKKIADPYRWMEDLNSPDVKAWVDAENDVTFKYLDSLPSRDQFKKRITELYNYPRVSAPFFEGRHWFYSRNTGLQKQSVVFTRETLSGTERVAIDPNEISPDGSNALAHYDPSPDGQNLAYGLAVGGSDLETFYVRDLNTGRQLPDEIKWMKFTSVQWTKDGKGFFYSRFPEPPPGQGLQVPDRDQKIYYHRLGTTQDKDPMLYARPEEPTLFIDPQLDESGRYLFIVTNKGTSEKNELFVKDLGDPLKPKIDAAIRPLYPGHTAAYEPIGVVNGQLYLRTDRSAPNSKIVSVAIDRPDAANWKTIVAETKNAIDSAHMVAGKLAVNRLVDVANEVSFYGLDGSSAIGITPPSLGTIQGPFGRFDRPEAFYLFTSPLSP